MTIIDKIIDVNDYNRPGKYSKPVTICIHYTGSPKTGADRQALYYKNVSIGVFKDYPSYTWTSAQYIVGQDGKLIITAVVTGVVAFVLGSLFPNIFS